MGYQKPLDSSARPYDGFLIWKIFQLFRHSGMDRRNPDCMDAHKPCRPWNLDSGGSCRNDGVLGFAKMRI